MKEPEYEMSDAELGEPSADCNCECDCGNLAEELADIKAMIGRLIRNGEES